MHKVYVIYPGFNLIEDACHWHLTRYISSSPYQNLAEKQVALRHMITIVQESG